MAAAVIHDDLDPRLSPHCLQNRQTYYVDGEFTDAMRRLDHDTYPESEYEPTTAETEITTVHYGRRQLLINEIEFLTMACAELEADESVSIRGKSIVVIYAGAAQGSHFPILAEFFPFVKFVLIDPLRFNLNMGDFKRYEPNFERISRKMDDSLAEKLSREYDDTKWIRLFISDIRSDGIRSDDPSEEQVKEDHKTQRRAHTILKPFMSYLKFRPPYYDKKKPDEKIFTYLDGEIYFLIWGRSKTSETRLVCRKDSGTREYDTEKYANQLHHFNRRARSLCYRHGVDVGGIDHCYDCRAEIYVLERFKESYEKIQRLLIRMEEQRKPYNFRGNTAQFVERINQLMKSDERLIGLKNNCSSFVVRLDDQILIGEYKFTKLKYGIRLDVFADFNRYFQKVVTKRPKIRSRPRYLTEDDLEAAMAKLNFNK